jgi:hypothetical protein
MFVTQVPIADRSSLRFPLETAANSPLSPTVRRESRRLVFDLLQQYADSHALLSSLLVTNRACSVLEVRYRWP